MPISDNYALVAPSGLDDCPPKLTVETPNDLWFKIAILVGLGLLIFKKK